MMLESETENIAVAIAEGRLDLVREARTEMVKRLVQDGRPPQAVCREISRYNRLVEQNVFQFFAGEYEWLNGCTFLEFGSGARDEQVLSSDQDNGLIWRERPDEGQLEEATQRMAMTLDAGGIRICPGDVMLSNEKWRGDFHDWRKKLTKWLTTPKVEGGWKVGTIVDFSPVCGPLDSEVQALSSELKGLVHDHPVILKNLAMEIAEFKAPVTFWGGFVLEREGPLKGSLDIKHAILAHLTNAARVLCLKHGIEKTNSRERVLALGEGSHIPKKIARDLASLWDWVQEKRINSNLESVQNIKIGVNPYRLDKEEQKNLRGLLHALDKFISLVQQGSGL